MTSGAKQMVFTDREKEILINLVSSDIRILEDKKMMQKQLSQSNQHGRNYRKNSTAIVM